VENNNVDRVKEPQEQRYNLQGFEVGRTNDGRYHWGLYITWKGIDNGKDARSYMSGKAWLEHDTFTMSPWKCDQESDFTNDVDEAKYMSSLPVWDKSKYYLKMGDVGDSGLRDCKTGGLVTDEKILNDLMPKLGFTKVGTLL
jgi:hypothetical protein